MLKDKTDKESGRTICLVIPTLQAGGMERVMSELAGYFASAKKINLHIIIYGKKREVFYKLPDSITMHQPLWPFINKYRLYYTVKTLLYLRRTVKEVDPNSIISFGEYWNSFVLLALKGLKYPVYVSDRCQPDKNLGYLHDKLRRWLYPGAAGIVAQTSIAKNEYEKMGLNSNIRVIGNPIPEINQGKKVCKFENIVLSVGRLIDTKHHDRLIKIFHKIDKKDWRLVIVGGNAIKQNGMERLKKEIKELKLEERVELTGNVSDVEKHYRQSDIFAFTSSSEGFPNAVGEAMSAGLPVISYDCVAGPADMVEDGKNGYLIELFDDQQFENRLRMLMENEKLRKQMGDESKKLIKKYRREKIGEEYFRFITERL